MAENAVDFVGRLEVRTLISVAGDSVSYQGVWAGATKSVGRMLEVKVGSLEKRCGRGGARRHVR